MRRVAVDANVFVSFFIDRNAAQPTAARALIQSAEDGEIVAVVPQSVVFEVAYVVQSQYGASADRLATVVRALTTFPGTQVVDECPWKRVLDIWPDAVAGLADSVIVAVAAATRVTLRAPRGKTVTEAPCVELTHSGLRSRAQCVAGWETGLARRAECLNL